MIEILTRIVGKIPINICVIAVADGSGRQLAAANAIITLHGRTYQYIINSR